MLCKHSPVILHTSQKLHCSISHSKYSLVCYSSAHVWNFNWIIELFSKKSIPNRKAHYFRLMMEKGQGQRKQLLSENCKCLCLYMYICKTDMKARKFSSIQNWLKQIGFLKLTLKEFSLLLYWLSVGIFWNINRKGTWNLNCIKKAQG